MFRGAPHGMPPRPARRSCRPASPPFPRRPGRESADAILPPNRIHRRSLRRARLRPAANRPGAKGFGKGSWVYAVVREWVAQGGRRTVGSGAIADLSVTPPDFAVVKPGQTLRIRVTATFADGTKEDVTPFCDFRVADDAIA